MGTTIRLTPHSEQLLREQLSAGSYQSAEEVVERALESLAHQNAQRNGSTNTAKMNPAEAIAEMMELRKNLTLGGLKIKDLINEGRKH
jgi:Arc/MetJ-type ribon-helix-helix transcriptional regulator